MGRLTTNEIAALVIIKGLIDSCSNFKPNNRLDARARESAGCKGERVKAGWSGSWMSSGRGPLTRVYKPLFAAVYGGVAGYGLGYYGYDYPTYGYSSYSYGYPAYSYGSYGYGYPAYSYGYPGYLGYRVARRVAIHRARWR
jgi:hypothetical protein